MLLDIFLNIWATPENIAGQILLDMAGAWCGHLCGTTGALADGLGSLRVLCFSADKNYISENLRQFEVGERSAESGDLSVSPDIPSD